MWFLFVHFLFVFQNLCVVAFVFGTFSNIILLFVNVQIF